MAVEIKIASLQTEIEPLARAHGVELVAVEWLRGPGRGLLRIFIDRPGGDPALPPDPERPGPTADLCARLSRDVSALLDALDLIPVSYDLEVGTPGPERPLQKRADFDRFAGRRVKVKVQADAGGRGTVDGVLRGTQDLGEDFAVRIEHQDRELVLPYAGLARARLVEVRPPPPEKPGRQPGRSKRSEGAPPSEGRSPARGENPEPAGHKPRPGKAKR